MIRIGDAGYPVWIGPGALDRFEAPRFFLVTDENVAAAGWGDRFPRPIGRFVLPPGEAAKTLGRVEALLDAMIEARLERTDTVLALGGGAVGDSAGFAASIFKRGCRLVLAPTSLLSQVDSAVGGKTAVNARQGKNLIGAFHRPDAVLIDPATLATLPDAELRAGYAEVLKYGLIGDPAFFAWCEGHAGALLAREPGALEHAIAHCVRAKAAVVAQDERETKGQRALLNLGHGFGHAIEAESNMRHGEAVAIGIALAFRLSARRGLCAEEDAGRVERHLAGVGLPTRPEGMDPARLARRMAHDKKAQGGRLALILVRGIGAAFLDQSVAPEALEAFLSDACS